MIVSLRATTSARKASSYRDVFELGRWVMAGSPPGVGCGRWVFGRWVIFRRVLDDDGLYRGAEHGPGMLSPPATAPRRLRAPAPHRRRRRTMKQGHRPRRRSATTDPRRGEKAAKRRRKFFGRWVLKIGRWVFGIGRWVLRPRLGRRVLGAAWALGDPWEGGGEVPTRFGGQGGGWGCREAVAGVEAPSRRSWPRGTLYVYRGIEVRGRTLHSTCGG